MLDSTGDRVSCARQVEATLAGLLLGETELGRVAGALCRLPAAPPSRTLRLMARRLFVASQFDTIRLEVIWESPSVVLE